jgi:hypothetical protein
MAMWIGIVVVAVALLLAVAAALINRGGPRLRFGDKPNRRPYEGPLDR